MRAAIGILVFAVSPSLAAAQMAKIEGDVYLLTRGGEVRQGAANQVFALPQLPQIAERWAGLCAGQSAAFTATNDEAAATRARMQAEIDAARDGRERLERMQALQGYLQASLDLLTTTVGLHAAERAEFLRSQASATAPTGMRARYGLELAPGAYWLFAEMPLAETEYRWLIPVKVDAGAEMVLDLDNSNTLSSFACDANLFGVDR